MWHSRPYLNGARGQPCVRCGANDGTVVSAHYTGLRQHLYGKGRGIKGSDVLVADLCRVCHEHFDQPQERKSIEASEAFLHCIAMTLIRRAEAGYFG
jgi:hypothetical protein